ncbi:hypothetical protein WJX79_007778 [Trebouxia sp. C0005]
MSTNGNWRLQAALVSSAEGSRSDELSEDPAQTALGTKYTLSTADGVVSEPAFAISLLQSVTEVLGTKSVSEIAIQTAEYDGSPLSLALQQLEDTYLKQIQEERERPYKSMEQRMAAYRQECETRLQEEVRRQVGQVRQVEVKAARAEGVNNAHHVASQERASLQQDQQERLQQLQAQEQQMLERMEKQQHDMHSSLLEQRQQLQAQEEDLATWKADAQRQLDIQQGRLSGREQRVASHEQMLTRQDAESACQVAEAQAAAASAYRNARRDLDQEYKAHREALDRERRTLEADRERVQKLEAEVVSLRGNNKRLKAAEVSWAEAEARAAAHAGVEEALRYQLSQLQNAVKGPGGGLGEGGIAAVYPPGQRAQGQGLDPAFLAVQLRKLQKKQKGVLRELQATAGREAFWKHSAHSAEQALDEAVEGREAALQQVEEARLALRAADRDNAELQARLQQASMSISSRHSQHAAPTARQLWAVPRERTGAIGSTAVSPVSRLGDIGKQEKKMRAELAQFKRQLQAQRDASALELQRLQHPSPSLGGSTSVPASALSVSTASSLSGYSTDVENGAMLTGPSPLPFVSPSHGLGPQMHPRLTPTSHTTSPRYTAYTRLETVGPGQSADNAQGQQATDAARQGSVADPLSVLQINLSAMEEAITLTDAAAVPPSQAGPLPASGAERDPESPLGGRPSQSETAVTNGKGVATMTEPQDLHAAHLVHVLQAHKAAQQLTDSAAVSSKLQPQRQVMDSLLAMDPAVQGDGSGIAAGSNRSLQQQGAFTGPGMLSQQHSKSEASEDAESVASQLQLLRSGELQAQASVPDLNELEGGSMMALPKEPSRHFVASGSDDDGFPAIDYNDVYKIKDTLAQDGFPEDLPEAEVASLGSISIADAEVELADFDAASGDSVF